MSGLWDYDDDAPPPQNWEAPPPPEPPSPEPSSSDDEKPNGKGRGRGKRGRSAKEKPANPSKGRGRGKRGQAAVTLEALASPPKKARTAEYIPDSDDDDVVLVLPDAPNPASGGIAPGGSSTAARHPPPVATGPNRSETHLDSATRATLEKERELISLLQQATAPQPSYHTHDLDHDAPPLQPTASLRLRPDVSMYLRRGRSGSEPGDSSRAGAGGEAGEAGGSGAGSGAGGTGAAQRGEAGGAREGEGAAGTAAGTDGGAAGGERVELVIRWAEGRDGQVVMRVLKSDPLSKLIDKFKEYAASRKLCADPSRIKLMYDGESLAASGDQTPEDMGLEDRDMIDVKLPKT